MTYNQDFTQAQKDSNGYFGDGLTPVFDLDTTWGTSLSRPIRTIGNELSTYFDTPHQMDSNCFLAVSLASKGLIRYQIPHAITVGDVEYRDGNLYTNATLESLCADIKIGFNPRFEDGVPTLPQTHAHCWITLPNGTILDPTISVHIDRLTNTPSQPDQSFWDAIYDSRTHDDRVTRHIPILTGLAYHMKSVTGISHRLRIRDEFFEHYVEWQQAYCSLMKPRH